MARILVAEDQPIIALTIAGWLDDLGHAAVGPASSLAHALALAEEEIDAAVIDVSLGREITAPLARRIAGRGLPFLVTTGHDPASLDSAFAGAPILFKPFMFESFRRKVEQMLAPGD